MFFCQHKITIFAMILIVIVLTILLVSSSINTFLYNDRLLTILFYSNSLDNLVSLVKVTAKKERW